MTKHKLGWVPDLPDHRDYKYKATVLEKNLPSVVDLRPKFLIPVEDQGNLGSCVAHSLTTYLEYLDMLHGSYEERSRLYVYYNARKIERKIKEDSGCSIRSGIKAIAKQGACPESMWTYDIEVYPDKFKEKPPEECYKAGADHKITKYERVYTLTDVKNALNEGFPVSFGFSVYESFFDIKEDGFMPMPKKDEENVGGHAVLAVGYNNFLKRLIVRNSWGTGFGADGYYFMPYDVVKNRNLSDDFWVIRKI